MTTIDHAAEARVMIRNAHKAVAKATINACLAEAQALAILALVEAQREANEQARIANIIALGTPRPVPAMGHDAEVWVATFEDDGTLRDDIKKGLGL